MKALVTGSAGFIGSHLMHELRRRGHDVVGVDRRSHPLTDRTLDLGDPRTSRRLETLARSVDVVFHLAARSGVRDRDPDIDRLRLRNNVLATRQLFEAVPARTPVVATSSSSVYGGALRQDSGLRPCREDHPLRPRGGYAESKVLMEAICEERRRLGGSVAVIRPFTVVGEGQRPDMALALWAEALLRRRPIRILGGPDRMRDLTDVRDVVRGLIEVADVGYDGVLNLGTGVGHRLSDMASALIEAAGTSAEILVEEAAPEEVDVTLADTTLCERTLGFVPSTDLRGVARRVWASLTAVPAVVGAPAR